MHIQFNVYNNDSVTMFQKLRVHNISYENIVHFNYYNF